MSEPYRVDLYYKGVQDAEMDRALEAMAEAHGGTFVGCGCTTSECGNRDLEWTFETTDAAVLFVRRAKELYPCELRHRIGWRRPPK